MGHDQNINHVQLVECPRNENPRVIGLLTHSLLCSFKKKKKCPTFQLTRTSMHTCIDDAIDAIDTVR